MGTHDASSQLLMQVAKTDIKQLITKKHNKTLVLPVTAVVSVKKKGGTFISVVLLFTNDIICRCLFCW